MGVETVLGLAKNSLFCVPVSACTNGREQVGFPPVRSLTDTRIGAVRRAVAALKKFDDNGDQKVQLGEWEKNLDDRLRALIMANLNEKGEVKSS